MAPTSRIFLTRHAQAEHNVNLEYFIPDAPLTPLGKRQAASLAPKIPKLQDEADLIITSPLKRTLQTTKLGWAPAIQRLGLANVICIPQAQECNDYPCDTGSSRSVLESDPEFAGFKFDRLTPDWTSKKDFWAPDRDSIDKRAQWVRQFLRSRPEQNIVLVAHGDILRAITRGKHGFSRYPWKNAECRIFTFDERYVESDECYLHEDGAVVAAGGYAPTSAEADITGSSAL